MASRSKYRFPARLLDWLAKLFWRDVDSNSSAGVEDTTPAPAEPAINSAGEPEHWRKLTPQGPPDHWLALIRERGIEGEASWIDMKVDPSAPELGLPPIAARSGEPATRGSEPGARDLGSEPGYLQAAPPKSTQGEALPTRKLEKASPAALAHWKSPRLKPVATHTEYEPPAAETAPHSEPGPSSVEKRPFFSFRRSTEGTTRSSSKFSAAAGHSGAEEGRRPPLIKAGQSKALEAGSPSETVRFERPAKTRERNSRPLPAPRPPPSADPVQTAPRRDIHYSPAATSGANRPPRFTTPAPVAAAAREEFPDLKKSAKRLHSFPPHFNPPAAAREAAEPQPSYNEGEVAKWPALMEPPQPETDDAESVLRKRERLNRLKKEQRG